MKRFYLSDLNLCHMVSQTQDWSQEVGGRCGRVSRRLVGWAAHSNWASKGLISWGILYSILGRLFSQIHLQGKNALAWTCVLCNGLSPILWLVLIFIGKVKGICGSHLHNQGLKLDHFVGTEVLVCEFPEDGTPANMELWTSLSTLWGIVYISFTQ